MSDAPDPPPPLNPDDRARIAAAVHGPAPDWPMPPLLPGPWTEADPAKAFDLLEMAGRYATIGTLRQPVPVAYELCRVRHRPLRCYGSAILVEALAQVPRPGLASFILHKDGVLWLTGRSNIIHQLNLDHPLDLTTAEARADYVQFFMTWIRSTLGRFQPVESAEVLAHRADPETLARIARHAAPLTIEAQTIEGGTWPVRGPILYGGQLFTVEMRLGKNGMVLMTDDTVRESDLALRREYMTRLLLWLGAEPETDPEENDP